MQNKTNATSLMRSFFLATVFSILLLSAFAQETYTAAIIELSIETIPSADNSSAGQTENQNFMRMMDGEIKTKIWMKKGLTKTEVDFGFGKSNVYYDSKNKKTTTLFEMMGRKMGFYASDDELQKMMNDSTANRNRVAPRNQEEVMIEYINEEKIIAERKCKKAIIHYMDKNKEEKEQLVWYEPSFLLEEGLRFSQLVRGAFVPGLQKIKGFPMEMEMKRPNGSISKYTVNRIQPGAELPDELFVVPSGYDIKPMSEMNQGGRGRFQFNMEND